MTIDTDFKALQAAVTTLGTRLTAAQTAYNTVLTRQAAVAADLAAIPVPPPPPLPDTTPPSVPTGLTATAISPTQVNLVWNVATDNVKVMGYIVYNADTGATIAMPATNAFVHSGLTPGRTYNYRVSAFDAIPNHSPWTAIVSVVTPGGTTVPVPTGSAVRYTLADFTQQSKVPGRVTIVQTDRGQAIRLHTEPGDTNVAGSDNMQRTDLYLTKPGTADPIVWGEGVEQWWSQSLLLPDDFAYPNWEMYVLMDFHNSTDGPWQANLHLNFAPQPTNPDVPGNLIFRGFGGATNAAGQYVSVIGIVQKNVWYDFIYHVKWSSGVDGFAEAWVNGTKQLYHSGPTLYAGQGIYPKLANYHVPVLRNGVDQPSSVIHAFPVRADTLADLGYTLDPTGQTLIKL